MKLEVKLNIFSLIGAAVCLLSMLFGYICFNLIVVKPGVSWALVAQYANYGLYAVPVIGVIMLIGGFIDAPIVKVIGAAGGIIFTVYYLITFKNILGGDLLVALNAAGIAFPGVSMSDIAGAVGILRPLTHLGVGAWMFIIGTLVYVAGIFLTGITLGGNAPAPQHRSKYDGSDDNDRSSFGSHY